MAFEVDYFTLSALDATRKYVILTGVPSTPTDVAMDLIGGTAQYTSSTAIPLRDFIVDSTKLTWGGYGLDGTMSIGDQVRVIYDRT